MLAYLRKHAARLRSLDPLVRGDEPDAVHQMRVTTRRLRSTLQSFGKIIPRSGTEGVLAELKWLGGVLGEARDAEVLASRLARNLRTIPPELVLGRAEARVRSLRPDSGGRAQERARGAGLGAVLRPRATR